MGMDAMIFVFWMLSFKPTFSLSSFTFIKRLFSYSSLSAIRVMPSAYLRLLIFLPAILIPACASSSPAFCMMYSEYKLNKQGGNTQPWHPPFPILNLWLLDAIRKGRGHRQLGPDLMLQQLWLQTLCTLSIEPVLAEHTVTDKNTEKCQHLSWNWHLGWPTSNFHNLPRRQQLSHWNDCCIS